MNNNQKTGTSTGQILALFDNLQSYNDDGIDELTNYSYTEFIDPEEIELIDNAIVLIPEASFHVVDEETTYTKELETNKKSKKLEASTPITCKHNVSPHSQEHCLPEGGVSYQFDINKAISIRDKKRGTFSLMLRK